MSALPAHTYYIYIWKHGQPTHTLTGSGDVTGVDGRPRGDIHFSLRLIVWWRRIDWGTQPSLSQKVWWLDITALVQELVCKLTGITSHPFPYTATRKQRDVTGDAFIFTSHAVCEHYHHLTCCCSWQPPCLLWIEHPFKYHYNFPYFFIF